MGMLRTMGAKSDLSNLQLFALRVAGGLMRDQLVVAQHVQQGCLSGIVEAQEQNPRFFVVKPQ